jgi:hypothetical protein
MGCAYKPRRFPADGSDYVTDWKAGSSFGWKGQDGNMYRHESTID